MHDGECPPETKPVFTNVWQGTEYGCVAFDSSMGVDHWISEGEGYVYVPRPESEYDCREWIFSEDYIIEPIGPI